MNIFLSYSWKNKTIADEIDHDWSQLGLKIIRDVRDLKFKQDLKIYMKGITKTDFVIVLISDDYLKSRNCMYEALEFMKDAMYATKILPIVVSGTQIYDNSYRLRLINYWEKQATDLQNEIRNVSALTATQKLIEELKEIELIRDEIDKFISSISTIKYTEWENAKKSNYSELFKYLGLKHSDIYEKAISISKITNKQKQRIELEKAIIKNPEKVTLQTLKAVLITEEGDFELGRELFTTLLDKHPGHDILKYNLAVIEDQHFNNRSIAETLYSEIIKSAPYYTDARVNLAQIWIEEGKNYDKARDYLNLSLYYNPDPARALYNLGVLHSNHYKNNDEALKYLNWAVDVNNSFQEAITLRALISYSISPDYKTLINELKKAVIIDDSKYYPQLVLGGHLYTKEKSKAEGMKYIEKAKLITERNIENKENDYNSKIALAYILKNFYSEDEKAKNLFDEGMLKRKDLNEFKL